MKLTKLVEVGPVSVLRPATSLVGGGGTAVDRKGIVA